MAKRTVNPHEEALKQRARTVCGCAGNVHGGCPEPSAVCVQKASCHPGLLASDVAAIRKAAVEEAASALEMSAQTIRLHAGEMTAQEMRTVQAILGWKTRELRAII